VLLPIRPGRWPNAAVTIRDLDRNVSFNTVSNENGNFAQQHLIAGRYQVEVKAPGFRTAIETNISVTTDTQVRLDLKMQIGDVNQSVEVTSESALLKTERSDVAVTYNQKAINELPMINRRFSNLQLITPGVMETVETTESRIEGFLPPGMTMYSAYLTYSMEQDDSVHSLSDQPTLESVTEAKITTAHRCGDRQRQRW
jgi:hypothetical protein